MNYDESKYEIWNWKTPLVLHWILNPALVINELLLGQTLPKVMLVEKVGDKPFYERSFIPCPHCETIHSGIKFSGHNRTALWNWYGYYCDNCSNIIPVLRNWMTLLVLMITFPIWGWFRKSLKQRWLDRQPKRFSNLELEFPKKISTTSYWLKAGLKFGGLTFSLFLISSLFFSDFQFNFIREHFLFMIFLFLIMGLAWGLLMKIFMTKYLTQKGTIND